MIKTVLKSLREYKKNTYYTLIAMFVEALMETGIFYFTAKFVDQFQSGASLDVILKTGGLLVLMAMLSLTSGAIGARTSAIAAAGLAKNLRSDIFESVQNFSFENIDKFSTSSLVTRMTTDITNIQMSFMMIIRIGIRSPLMLTFSVIMAASLGGKLSLTYIVIIPILVTGLLLIAKFAIPAFRRVFKKYDKLNESVEENVTAMRVVKGFTREEYEKKKFNEASNNIRKEFTFAERIVVSNEPLMQLCIYINWLVILVVGSYVTISSQGKSMGAGSISIMISYGFQVLISLMMLSMIYVMITMSAESGNRITEVLKEKATLESPENPITEIKDGSIDFEDVSFKYYKRAKEYTLSNINLHIKSGMTVGILGNTGSSKSTLVQLIPRLYDTTLGVVKVGGVDVKEYDIKTLRDNVSVVLQKNILFSGTIADNLRWGNPNATLEDIVDACKLAQADEFIRVNPNGYNKMIEQGGTNVSGGQKQRLCIARALLKKPKILILDDSTSAVDTKTDALIREGLKQYIPETTKIIISQRVTSVMDADMIIIMDEGKIAGMGTHDELLKTSEAYKNIYEHQTRGGEKDA